MKKCQNKYCDNGYIFDTLYPCNECNKGKRMKITRINAEKHTDKDVNVVQIAIGDNCYTLTERFGKLNILSDDSLIQVNPCSANQIDVK